MRADTHQYPVVWRIHVKEQPCAGEEQFAALWRKYEPKVRKMAMSYRMDAVGAELDDLVAIGQATLLCALRTYDPSRTTRTRGADGVESSKSVEFSTHFWNILRNNLSQLAKVRFPKDVYEVKAGERGDAEPQEIVAVEYVTHRGVRDEAGNIRNQVKSCSLFAPTEIEPILIGLRAQGKSYHLIRKTPTASRAAIVNSVVSLDAEVDHDKREPRSRLDTLASPEDASYEELVARIRERVPDDALRQIALWLFDGRKMSGPGGIQEELGMNKRQAERALHQIRMLLAGEFGLHFVHGEGWVQ